MTERTVSLDGPEGLSSGADAQLKGESIATRHIVASVIAAAAPIAGIVGLVPLAILLGNGVGTPGAILLIAMLLVLFSVGFVRIVPHVRNAGAFYAYVSQGIGKATGLGTAYVLTLSYIALSIGVVGGFGFFGQELLHRVGIDIPWIWCAVFGILAATALSISGIQVAARVLLAILVLETLALLVMDVGILAQVGLGAFSFDAFNPNVVFSGAIGVAAIYGFSCFLGFEGTAIYAEEAKDANQAVPKATYIVIVLVGLFYGLSAWVLIAGAGFDQAVGRSGEDPGLFVYGLAEQYVGSGLSNVIGTLNIVSLFAGALAFQNAGARYLFALGRDGVLPNQFAHTSPRLGSPIPALLVVGGLALVVTVAFYAAGQDPFVGLSTTMTGFGTIGLIASLTVTSFAIGIFFFRRGERTVAKVGAPILAGVLLAACAVAGIVNYDALAGSESSMTWLPVMHVVMFAGGIAFAIWSRTKKRSTYENLGTTRV
ncbi:APC family permease [Arthrobacter sp. CAU 1506]|uniref:APC family permease n=1 Tax=Arthrobacter sp. CAU 1506 TaxID=2560052 RepID=UPI00145F4C3B|nr:APC family permease [Arthrobacter sp. CAU 1506]